MLAPDDSPPPLARVFLALMVGSHLGRRALRPVSEALGQAAGANLRLYRPEDLHLTLVFLGPVGRARLDPLGAAVEAGLPREGALGLGLGRSGAFPRSSAPRVLWLSVEERRAGALEQLARLREALARICRQQDFAIDPRPFLPHLTVARLRGHARPPPGFWDVDVALDWSAAEVALVESVMGAGQSAFRVQRTWSLEPLEQPPGEGGPQA